MGKRVRTSTEKGHSHAGIFDETGYGMTSYDNDHKHQITEFRILKTHGHIHTIKE